MTDLSPQKLLLKLCRRWAESDVSESTCAVVNKCLRGPLERLPTHRNGARCKELWIHVGTHKTGSTLAQSILKRRRQVLRCQSIHFESFGYRLGKRLMHESPLDPESLEGLRAHLEERLLLRTEAVAILSSESLCGNPYGGYANVAAVAADLRQISRSFDVRIVMVVRRQDDFLESIYGQYLKEGGTKSFDEFSSGDLIDAFDWQRLVTAYQTQFGADRVKTVSYDDLAREPSRAVEVLFGDCGKRFVCRARVRNRINRGLSGTGLEMARRCNGLLDPSERKLFRRFLETSFGKRPGEVTGVLSESIRERVLRRYGLDAPDGAERMRQRST